MFVLDSDICVDLHRGHGPSIDLVDRLESQGPLAVTAITVHELVQGIRAAADPERENLVLQRLLSAFDVLEFNGASGWIAGRVSAELIASGKPIGDLDTMIAACAIAHGGLLVTRNVKHFQRVPGIRMHPAE